MIFNLIQKAKEVLYKNGKSVEAALDEVNENLGKLGGLESRLAAYNDIKIDGVLYENAVVAMKCIVLTENNRILVLGNVTSSTNADVWIKYVATNKLLIQKGIDGTYTEWESVVLNSDLANYLPKTESSVSIQTVDGSANRLMTQAYKGTKTTNDGRMYVQADYNAKHVIIGILGVGEVGVNKATGANYIGDGSKRYDQLHIRECANSSPHDNYMYLQQTKVGDKVSVELGINGLGGIGVSRALCDRNGNRIDTTYAKVQKGTGTVYISSATTTPTWVEIKFEKAFSKAPTILLDSKYKPFIGAYDITTTGFKVQGYNGDSMTEDGYLGYVGNADFTWVAIE